MVQSHDVTQPSHLAGENVPSWFASILALVGIIGSIITAWLVVPEGLQSDIVDPWVTMLDDRYRKNSDISSNNSDLLTVETATNNLELETFSPQTQETTAIANLKRDESLGRENDMIPENEENQLIEEEATKKDKTIAPKEEDCPPLFPFTFTRGSIEPISFELDVKIMQLSEWLLEHPDAVVIIDGHTSSVGTDEFNLLLSYRRSKAVHELLSKSGVSSEQLATRAFGEQITLPGELSSSGRNRRVSLRIDGLSDCHQNPADGGTN